MNELKSYEAKVVIELPSRTSYASFVVRCLLNSVVIQSMTVGAGVARTTIAALVITGQFPSLCPFATITYAHFLWSTPKL